MIFIEKILILSICYRLYWLAIFRTHIGIIIRKLILYEFFTFLIKLIPIAIIRLQYFWLFFIFSHQVIIAFRFHSSFRSKWDSFICYHTTFIIWLFIHQFNISQVKCLRKWKILDLLFILFFYLWFHIS